MTITTRIHSYLTGKKIGEDAYGNRQIEAKALRKLKHPSRSRKLRSFLDY
jgi:DNA-directed RNA polymerase sigma subunit (sigma70/sigma32)